MSTATRISTHGPAIQPSTDTTPGRNSTPGPAPRITQMIILTTDKVPVRYKWPERAASATLVQNRSKKTKYTYVASHESELQLPCQSCKQGNVVILTFARGRDLFAGRWCWLFAGGWRWCWASVTFDVERNILARRAIPTRPCRQSVTWHAKWTCKAKVWLQSQAQRMI